MLDWQRGAVGLPRTAKVLIPAVSHSKPHRIVFHIRREISYKELLILMLVLILVIMSVMMVAIIIRKKNQIMFPRNFLYCCY